MATIDGNATTLGAKLQTSIDAMATTAAGINAQNQGTATAQLIVLSSILSIIKATKAKLEEADGIMKQ